MNGLLVSDQTSANNWDQNARVMLHERVQASYAPALLYQDAIFGRLEDQMAGQEAEFEGVIASLKGQFIFTNAGPIEAFLKMHRALASILLEAADHLKECFGPSSPRALEIMSEEGASRSIYALVLWSGERTQARSALNKFDELWWMNNLKKAGGRIVFDYELL